MVLPTSAACHSTTSARVPAICAPVSTTIIAAPTIATASVAATFPATAVISTVRTT